MMTWYLWRAFYDSLPRHPLFWRTMNWRHQRKLKEEDNFGRWAKLIGLFVLGVITFGTIGFGFILFFILIVYLLPFGGALLGGANAAVGIGSIIALEREQGRYDLVALTPAGMFGVGWALSTRYLRTNRGAIRLKRLVQALHVVMVLMILGIYALVIVSSGYFGDLDESGITEFLAILIGLGAVHLDFVQSVLLGALVGILAPTYGSKRIDASIAGMGIFLLAQFGVYVGVIVGLWLVLSLLQTLGIQDYAVILALTALMLVYIAHEVALYCIWQVVQRRLNIESDALQTLNRYGS